MQYSFNIKGEDFVRAQSFDVNVSYKKLGAVCDAVRYLKAEKAIDVLDLVISKERAIPFRRHNKHMGSRSELGGAKGGYPTKAAAEVRKTIVNAIANAGNKGKSGSDMVIVCASANKTRIERRYPSKGSLAWGRGMYGMSAINHSDIEYAKIEIVLADDFSEKLTKNMKYFIRKRNKEAPQAKKPQAKAQQKAATPAISAAKPAQAPQMPKAAQVQQPAKEQPKKEAEQTQNKQ